MAKSNSLPPLVVVDKQLAAMDTPDIATAAAQEHEAPGSGAAGEAADKATGVAVDKAAGRVKAGDAGGVAGVGGGAAPRAANQGETRPVARGAPSKPGGGPREARGRPSLGAGEATSSEGTCWNGKTISSK